MTLVTSRPHGCSCTEKFGDNSNCEVHSPRRAVPRSPKVTGDGDYVPYTDLGKSVVDMVNHPPHYTFGKFEVLDVLMDWFSTEPLLWQVCKYIARAGKKGSMLEDLEKAEFYLKKRIALLKEKQ